MLPVTILNILLVIVSLITTLPAVNADCCYDRGGRCGDCESATPFCGRGSCNMFGCKCDGGCRYGTCWSRNKRSLDEEFSNAEAIVTAGDTNGDGRLSVEEAEFLKQKAPNARNPASVQELDTNKNGFLSIDEIDAFQLL